MQLDSTNFEIKVLAVDFLQDVDAASMLLPYVNYNLFLTFNLSLSTYQHGTNQKQKSSIHYLLLTYKQERKNYCHQQNTLSLTV